MDPLKALIVATLLCVCFVRALCDVASASPSPEKEKEIQMLRSKVASLEDDISRREEETSELESVVRERTAQMATLVGDLELLQKVNLGDDESAMKASTHDAMLEKQIERLGNDLEDQIRKGESLEARAIEAERSLHEFGHKLEHAEKTIIEQKKKIQDLSDRLQYAQKLVPVARGHLDALRNATAAFTAAVANSSTCRGVIRACTVKAGEFADNYRQVQNGVKRFLEGNRQLTPLSAEELAWTAASALLALPALRVYKIVAAIFRRKNQARKDRLQKQGQEMS